MKKKKKIQKAITFDINSLQKMKEILSQKFQIAFFVFISLSNEQVVCFHFPAQFQRAAFIFYQDIIINFWYTKMSDRPFSPITGQAFKVENYYFQIIMGRLIARTPIQKSGGHFIFTVFKGNQKYEATKTIGLQFGSENEYSLQNAKINFVAINYNPSKSLSFDLRMIENSEDVNKEIGEYVIDANSYIDHFRQSQNGAFTLKVSLNPDWAAEFELYVEKSRYGVERLIHQMKNPKPKKGTDETPLVHQNISQQKKKLEEQREEKEQQLPIHHHIFKKFPTRRDLHDDFPKKNQKPTEIQKDYTRKQSQSLAQEPKNEKLEKKPKGSFVPKKEWIIPEAEKYIAMTKANSRAASVKNDSSIQQNPPINPQKRELQKKVSAQQQSQFIDKLPLKPKYLIFTVLGILLLYVAYTYMNANAVQELPLGPDKQVKPRKQPQKEVVNKKTPQKKQKPLKAKK